MKSLWVLVFVLAGIAARADDNVLQNGDFSSGLDQWDGDAHLASDFQSDPNAVPNLNAPANSPASASGVVVKLRSGNWTQMTQSFTAPEGEYDVEVTYTVSADYKPSLNPDDYANVLGDAGLGRIRNFAPKPGEWLVAIRDPDQRHFTSVGVKSSPSGGAPQTFTGHITLKLHKPKGGGGDDDDDDNNGPPPPGSDEPGPKIFYLLFPPGDGMVTILRVSVTRQG